jgi:hypothetical protein
VLQDVFCCGGWEVPCRCACIYLPVNYLGPRDLS